MKTFRYLTIAVLGLVMAACSSDIASEQPVVSHQGKGIPFTATISMRGSATRSVMTESTSTISAAWETGDELALVYEVSGQKQVTKATMTVSDDKSATITATIAEGVITGTTVKLLYPYSAVCNDPAEAATYGTMREDALAGQDGTLETIAKDYDLCQGDGEFTLMSDGTASLKADVTMASQIAIWKLSLSDGANAISASKLVVKDGSDNVLTTVTLAPATSSLYIAMAPANSTDMKFEATVGEDVYTYSKTGITFKAGKYYVSTMAMNAPEPEKMTVNATGYKATYDGKAHGITVTVTEPATGATIKYGEKEGTYDKDKSPTYTDAGKHTVYYQVTKDKYETVTGSADVEITQAAATISFKEATITKTYGDAAFTNTLTNTGDGAVKYSTTATNVTVNESTGEVTIIGAGEATIKATVTDGTNYTYATKEISYTLTVNKKAGSISFATAAPSQALSATTADNTYTQTVTNNGDGMVTYSISDNTCGATINASTGEVKFTKVGSVKVTATVAVAEDGIYSYATKTASYTLTVIDQGAVEDYNVNNPDTW